MEEHDIPKRVILVLVVLTIVISVLGTWTVMDAVSRAPEYKAPKSVSTGTVSLEIIDPYAKEESAQDDAKVSIEILDK